MLPPFRSAKPQHGPLTPRSPIPVWTPKAHPTQAAHMLSDLGPDPFMLNTEPPEAPAKPAPKPAPATTAPAPRPGSAEWAQQKLARQAVEQAERSKRHAEKVEAYVAQGYDLRAAETLVTHDDYREVVRRA